MRLWCILAISIAVVWPAHIRAAECHVDTSRARQVRFISDAPVEDFDGTTTHIDGYVYFDGPFLEENIDLKSSEFYFEVDLNDLDTGIGLRNRHMRENYLETDQFPFAHFSGKLTEVHQAADSSFEVRIEGQMFIHGIRRDWETTVLVTIIYGGYRVQTAFDVALPDFKIKIPKLMFLKISEIVRLELDFHLRTITRNPGEGS